MIRSDCLWQMMSTFFDCLTAYLQKGKKTQTYHNWFLINYSGLVKCEKDANLQLTLPNHKKFFLKKLPMTTSIGWPGFKTKRFTIQKIYSKMQCVLSTNAHHDLLANTSLYFQLHQI